MTNDSNTQLATFAAELPALNAKEAGAALKRGADDAASDGGDKIFLSFSGKQNRYRLGRDKTEPDPDTVYAVSPGGMLKGWNLWKGGTVPKKHLWSIYDTAKEVTEDQLDDPGELGANDQGWVKVLGLTMLDIDDPDRRQIQFTVDSISARNVVAAIMDEVGERMMVGEPAVVPLMQLGSEPFTAQGNTNYKPLPDILGWCAPAELQAFLDDEGATLDDLFDGKFAGVPDEEHGADPDPEPKEKKAAAKKPARQRRKAA